VITIELPDDLSASDLRAVADLLCPAECSSRPHLHMVQDGHSSRELAALIAFKLRFLAEYLEEHERWEDGCLSVEDIL
jgi:hypothetical protein